MKKNEKKIKRHHLIAGFSWVGLMTCIVGDVAAGTSGNLGSMAAAMTDNIANLAKLITAASYLAGLGFAVGAIMKFKAHKDNPQSTPIGTPIGLTFIAGSMLFLPSILAVTGMSMFGTKPTTATHTGMLVS